MLPSSITPFLSGAPRMPDEQELRNLQSSLLSAGGALTASLTSVQAGSTPLNNAKNFFGAVANAGDSFLLPPATVPGQEVWCYNTTATSADVFPNVDDAIDAGAANAAQAVAGGAKTVFVCVRVKTNTAGGLWAAWKSA